MKVLLDTEIFSRSELMELVSEKQKIKWGDADIELKTQRLKRLKPDKNHEKQNQIECIHTLGRLIREERIFPFTYNEINFERARGRSREPVYNALRNCGIKQCPSAIERSKFRSGDIQDHIRKGGKKDAKSNISLSNINQLPFLEWLSTLSSEAIIKILEIKGLLKLTEHEVSSFQRISVFQEPAKLLPKEDLVDLFHLWTAERANMNAFLTLDKKFQKKIFDFNQRTKQKYKMNCRILTPFELLLELGITETDPLPAKEGKLYNVF